MGWRQGMWTGWGVGRVGGGGRGESARRDGAPRSKLTGAGHAPITRRSRHEPQPDAANAMLYLFMAPLLGWARRPPLRLFKLLS